MDIIAWILIALGASFLTIAISCCVVSSRSSRLEEKYRQEEQMWTKSN